VALPAPQQPMTDRRQAGQEGQEGQESLNEPVREDAVKE